MTVAFGDHPAFVRSFQTLGQGLAASVKDGEVKRTKPQIPFRTISAAPAYPGDGSLPPVQYTHWVVSGHF